MKKEYTIPTIEVIEMLNENILTLSSFDEKGILEGETDGELF